VGCNDISDSDGSDNSTPFQAVVHPVGHALNARAFKNGPGGPLKVSCILHSYAY